ncbi:MAG TPA: hypothetical protein VGD21_15865 [Lysobacter sp.]
MRRSDIKTIFDSKAYGDFKKGKEGAHKVDSAIIDRLDNLIRAVGALGKVMAKSR